MFKSNISAPFSVRALGVTVSGFDNGVSQITLDETYGNYQKLEKVERCVDEIRKKYGYDKLQRGIVAEEPSQMRNDIKNSHLIKPANFEDRSIKKDIKKGLTFIATFIFFANLSKACSNQMFFIYSI